MGYDESSQRWPDPPPPDAAYRGIPSSVLDDVFDDPRHGDPGRDRLGVHLFWEALLLVAVGVLIVLLYREDPAVARGAELASLQVSTVTLGLLALGAGLSLRTGAPNLAVGPVAVASAQYFSEQGAGRLPAALGPAAAVAAAVGLLLALVVVGFHVPAWAASLAAGMAIMAVVNQHAVSSVDTRSWYDSTRHASYLFAGYAALSLLGGMLGTIKAIRRSLGRFRPVADPARRRGGVAAVITAMAIVASTVFATLAGVLLAPPVGGPVGAGTGFAWTGLALGAALVGGTSVFGRRGGIFGTFFAVLLFILFFRYADERAWQVPQLAVAAAAIAAGLVVTRLVESFGRPRSAVEAEEEWLEETGNRYNADWLFSRTGEAEPWTGIRKDHTDPWDADRWGGSSGR